MDTTTYVQEMQHIIDEYFKNHQAVVLENPTDIGKHELVKHLIKKYGRTLYISPSYDINRQWNDDKPELISEMVFATYNYLLEFSFDEITDFIRPYDFIILDEVHHAGTTRYLSHITSMMQNASAKIFGMTTHTKRYSDNAQDVADTIFGGHKINGISFENAIKQGMLPQFDYISALYSLPKDINELITSSSLAKKIVSDSGLVQVNEDGIKNIIKKHMPEGNRKVVYFVPSVEDSQDAEKMAKYLDYGKTYVINYTKTDKENHEALKAYNEADAASLICISKFNEGAIPKGTNTVVMLRRTVTINIFERQVLTALQSANAKAIVYDFVSNIDNLIYSKKSNNKHFQKHYTERIKALCNQSIVIDYTKQWVTVFDKLRALTKNGWTQAQDEQLKRLYPQCGNEIYKYITHHSPRECHVRAELLGLKYEPVPEIAKDCKEQPNDNKVYDCEFDKFDATIYSMLSPETIKSFCEMYLSVIDTGHAPGNIELYIKDQQQINALLLLSDNCIKHTHILNPDCERIIKQRQNIFRAYIDSYTSSFNRKAVNMVVVNGKVFQGNDVVQEIQRVENERKVQQKLEQGKMVLVDGQYVDAKNLIAGSYGMTAAEHLLYKTYRRILLGTYKDCIIGQLVKEFSDEDVVEKITDLRNQRHEWSDADLQKITNFSKKNDMYTPLLRRHSDLDILEKATEMNKTSLIAFSQGKSTFFDNNFKAFIKKYKKSFEHRKKEEEKKIKQQQLEEENRRLAKERKKQWKNTKTTLVVVSKKGKTVSVVDHKKK